QGGAAPVRDGHRRSPPSSRPVDRGGEAWGHHLAVALHAGAPGGAADVPAGAGDQGHLLLRRELAPRRAVVPVALPHGRAATVGGAAARSTAHLVRGQPVLLVPPVGSTAGTNGGS